MMTVQSGLPPGPGVTSPVPDSTPEWAASLAAFLAGGEPRSGYEILLHRAADIGLYDVVRTWSMTDNPMPIDRMTVRLLLPPDILAAVTAEMASSEDEVLAALTTELPLAVRRYSTRQRFNRFGHTGCHGEDPVRR
ncbi:hypothetical protein ACLRDC_01150 [Gluconacetobacter sacchari]|uniref:Uncharacterized protein n=2 Tax=Gluconacetobacter sacchari TaxID=92759 RepID=A0A7W4IB81_9PROT|nr:hypothetical protein [Gluconacetobacter sacchari]MBB2159670.1 hypothetical protein [Gluconacetobacter sacchari]GBQ27472.1 hypothetical protein AA12717_2693 [Gluconacetobacter sacchari DSM 12717]